MGVCSKLGLAVLVLAIGCTPALAQQGPPDQPPPPPSNGAQAGPGPGGPRGPMRNRGMHVWVDHGRGRGWAEWPSRPGDWGSAMGMGEMRRGGAGLNRAFGQAERALNNPQVRQQLGISDQQATKLEQQATDFLKTMVQDRANVEIQRIDLQSLLAAENPDRSAIDNQLQKVSDAQLALRKSIVDFMLNLKQEITPEQRQKIQEFLRARRMGNFGRENGGWQGGAGGRQPNMRRHSGRQQNWQRHNNSNSPQNSQGEPQGSTPQTTNQ